MKKGDDFEDLHGSENLGSQTKIMNEEEKEEQVTDFTAPTDQIIVDKNVLKDMDNQTDYSTKFEAEEINSFYD